MHVVSAAMEEKMMTKFSFCFIFLNLATGGDQRPV
jgi:hypothetical protein